MIKVFVFGRFIAKSIFFKETTKNKYQSILRENGIIITSDEATADIIMACGTCSKKILAKLLMLMLKYGRKKAYLIWTDEPRFDIYFTPIVQYPLLPQLHIFNIFTGATINNYRWLLPNTQLEFLKDFEFHNRKIVAVTIYRNNQREWSLKYQGRELDLCYLRTQIALTGYRMDLCDIYGHAWPNGIALGKSSNWDNRRQEKREILKKYHFNLAFENTNWPYYCTEKIWQSIQFGCLPIYYGKGNAIYEDFPQNSFIDYCKFDNPQDLFQFIQIMSPQEFMQRMNLCIEAFNQAILKGEKVGAGNREMVELTAKRIHEIVGR